MNRGLVHIYYGDGKGKTTAAFGLAFRCAGQGGKVIIAQFLKGSVTGEVLATENFASITVLRGKSSGKFTFQMNEEEKRDTATECLSILENAANILKGEEFKLLILDEVIDACETGMISKEKLLDFLSLLPEKLEVVMTGHSLPDYLEELADYITQMRKIKHPYDEGITARKYIEF